MKVKLCQSFIHGDLPKQSPAADSLLPSEETVSPDGWLNELEIKLPFDEPVGSPR